MHDLPTSPAFQQSHARSVSGEDLETFGKKAAQDYSSGRFPRLSDSVIETVKHAGLSPEQVRRVVEFANQTAYLQAFNKEGAHRVIEFPGGPADPASVLQDLNDGGGGTVFDRGTLDYSTPPTRKHASADVDREVAAAFAVKDVPLPRHNPFVEIHDLRDKLASAYDHHTSRLSGLETIYHDLSDELYKHVKQAALNGTSIGEVVRAWSHVVDDPTYVKVAFSVIGPRLLKDAVFRTPSELSVSIEKTGSARAVNLEHPIVVTMTEFCDALHKLAQERHNRDIVKESLDQTTRFLLDPKPEKLHPFFDNLINLTGGVDQKLAAAPGVLSRIAGAFHDASKPVATGAGHVGDFLFGKGAPQTETLKSLAGGAVKYAPHLAGAAVAVRGAQHLNALSNTPLGQALMSFVPGTQPFNQKNQELTFQYGGVPGYY